MKRLFAIFAFSLLAGSAAAGSVETALSDENILWSIDGDAERASLVLTMRNGDLTQNVLIPTTDDAARDAQPRLLWDAASRTLFVMWRRETDGGDEIRLARRYSSGRWAPPIVIAAADGSRRAGLQMVITAPAGESATLVHAVWWSLRGDRASAEYSLIAFQGAELLSTAVEKLEQLAGISAAIAEDGAGKSLHPPLTMVAADDGVDVAFGAMRSTAVTRLKIVPGKVAGNARMWRPSGRSGRSTGSAAFSSLTAAPVQSFIIGGRVVLYTPDSNFRYVIFDGAHWTPVRMLRLDEKLTSEDLLRELKRSVESDGAEIGPASE